MLSMTEPSFHSHEIFLMTSKEGRGKYLKSKKLFRPSFQLLIHRKYKDCKIMLKSTKSSEPNTYC